MSRSLSKTLFLAEDSVDWIQNPTSETYLLDNNTMQPIDPELVPRKPDPYDQAKWISRLFFCWPYALLRLGMQKTIEEKDLPEISESDSSRQNLLLFERIWKQELERVRSLDMNKKSKSTLGLNKPSLQRAVIVELVKSTWMIQPLLFASEVSKIVEAICLGYLIQSMAEKSTDGYIWATVLCLCNGLALFEYHHVFFISWRRGYVKGIFFL